MHRSGTSVIPHSRPVMLIKKPDDIRPSEITPEEHYLNRRRFLAVAGGVGIAAAAGVAVPRLLRPNGDESGLVATADGAVPGAQAEKLTPYAAVTTYNNFYEFGTSKEDPAENAKAFRTRPWSVVVDGLVKRPATYNLEDFVRPSTQQERVYRMRCVEAWSMVIPWLGFPLSDVLRRAEPTPAAKFVEFTTLMDPKQMPGERTNTLNWPYKEGLRLDEAMHPLAIMATGLYGKPLPNQNGAPLRLVVPWKYGFKGIKSIVRIRLTSSQPRTAWNDAAADEYGFYANVNPAVDHPRWSQAKERRIGEFRRRATLPFNGYASQVASLYSGMDLRRYY